MSEFDKFAKDYNSNLDAILQSSVGIGSDYFSNYKIKELYKYVKEKKITNILDFGCGIGKNTILLNKYFPDSNIFGIDISASSIHEAKELSLTSCKFSIYDGINLDFEDGFFDFIFISNVFHHINYKEHLNILKELIKILSPKGYIFFFEHNTLNPVTFKIVNECEFDKDAKLINYRYSKHIFKEAGFNFIQNKFILFIPPRMKKLLFLEKYLTWLPFGGQYYIVARK